MDTRSPLEGIFNIIGGLPQGHDKPVKHALYNAVAIFLLVLSCSVGWALYVILEPFIKPLMWALLVGSVLHPIKRSLRDRFQGWFESLEESHTPIVLGVILLPINIINDLSEFIGYNIVKHLKLIIVVSITIPLLHVLYYYTPNIVVLLCKKLFFINVGILNFFLNNATVPVVILILIAYSSLVLLTWKPHNNKSFHYASMCIWLLLSCYLANFFGSFKLPIFIVLQLVFIGGFISEVYEIYEAETSSGKVMSFKDAVSLALHSKRGDECAKDQKNTNEVQEDEVQQIFPEKKKAAVNFDPEAKVSEAGDVAKPKRNKDPWALDLFEEKPHESATDVSKTSFLITNEGIHVIQEQPQVSSLSHLIKPTASKSAHKLQRSLSQPHFDNKKVSSSFFTFRRLNTKDSGACNADPEKSESLFYLYSVIWACVIMLFWKNVMLIPLLPLPILLYVFKHVGLYLGVWQWIYKYYGEGVKVLKQWAHERLDALVPIHIRGLFKVIHKVNIGLKAGIKDSIDTVSSCVVIFGLIVFLICASVFIFFQIYAEAIMMVQITSNVINQTVVHNPELRQLLPPHWDETVDSILDNAYQYGREGISKAVKGMMAEADSAKSEKLEKQILELWDRLYQSWMASDDKNGPMVTQEAVLSSWEAFVTDIQKSPEMFNVNGLIEFAKQNIGTLMSLLESVWSIVKGNISLVLGSFSAFLSVILGGGTAVLNFLINTIVFLTTLFYLLSSSGDLYKPVEIMTNFSSSGSRLGHALEGAINGVFNASFKMAAFYGLWTWFIHNLFGVRIVYLPSAFATILGAVPFLGTYWAGVPAVLDLWLAQDRGIAAILFAIFQFLPTSVVDTAIYKEIRGGHPYLTGLAIAGGIFCLGMEGAIIGPILLCGLYVAIDLSSSLFKESPSEESLKLRLHQLQDA